MVNHIRDDGPLPEGALKALSFINEKDARIVKLEQALEIIKTAWADYGGNITVLVGPEEDDESHVELIEFVDYVLGGK